MSDCWYAIPSALPVDACNKVVASWRAAGYKVAVFRDEHDEVRADMVMFGTYPGYAQAVNALVKVILEKAPNVVNIIGTGGDDHHPPRDITPAKLEAEFLAHFGGTFGVMQPMGDQYGALRRGAAQHAATSPWMGREWCLRANGGKGPLWPEYFHFFVDTELWEVAKAQGVLWPWETLVQYHDHHERRRKGPPPAYLAKAKARWAEGNRLFLTRKAAGFPGSACLAKESGSDGSDKTG